MEVGKLVKKYCFTCSDIAQILYCYNNEATRNNVLSDFKKVCVDPKNNSSILKAVGSFNTLAEMEMGHWKAY